MKNRLFHGSHQIAPATALAVLAAMSPGQPAAAHPAAASDTELDTLRARVAALESTASPLSFNVGADTRITIYGYIKGDLIYDSGYDLGRTTFGLTTIGLPGGPAAGNFTRGQASQSRFGFKIDGGDFKARVEGDFFGAGNGFRLRHAYGEWNGILVGQTWSNFMPLESYPSTVDFEGPVGIPFARVQQVRYSYISGPIAVAASLEADVAGTSSRPAITGSGQYTMDRGSIRVAAISRRIPLGGADRNIWGVTVGGVANLWQGGTFVANYSTGDGNADLLVSGLGGTAQFVGGQTIEAEGITLGISQDIGEKFTIGAAWGRTRMDVATGVDTRELESIHLSAWYRPVEKVEFGLEYFTGTRTQGNGIAFDADRVQFAGRFFF